jgi:hypothetical protein
MAVVGALLIGCAGLLAIGCSSGGVRSEVPKEEKQGHTEGTKGQARSPEATASEEDARCEKTRSIDKLHGPYLTNDVPGCPNGGLLSGTDKPDRLAGEQGEDEVRGLGAADRLTGGHGPDVIYGGPGDDTSENVLHGESGRDELNGAEGDDLLYGGAGDDVLWGAGGEDVLYGEDGRDHVDGTSDGGERDKLYCGEGKDEYVADKKDYVSSSCEVKVRFIL